MKSILQYICLSFMRDKIIKIRPIEELTLMNDNRIKISNFDLTLETLLFLLKIVCLNVVKID